MEKILGGGYSSSVVLFLHKGFFYIILKKKKEIADRSSKLCSYLTGVTASNLQEHLSDMNMAGDIFMFLWFWEIGKN